VRKRYVPTEGERGYQTVSWGPGVAVNDINNPMPSLVLRSQRFLISSPVPFAFSLFFFTTSISRRHFFPRDQSRSIRLRSSSDLRPSSDRKDALVPRSQVDSRQTPDKQARRVSLALTVVHRSPLTALCILHLASSQLAPVHRFSSYAYDPAASRSPCIHTLSPFVCGVTSSLWLVAFPESALRTEAGHI